MLSSPRRAPTTTGHSTPSGESTDTSFFKSQKGKPMKKWPEYGDADEMKRPAGITVIAVINILAGISLGPRVLLSPQRPQGALIALLALVLFGVGISVALLM